MSKIKIAYLIDTLHSITAGTEKQLMGIIERLDRDIFEPYLICLWRSPWMEKNEIPVRVIVLEYNGFIKPSFINVLRKFKELINQYQFDIIQTFFEDSIFVGYLGKKMATHKPVLLSSRRDMGLGSDEPWYHSLFKIILPLVNRDFRGIVANGQMVKGYIAKREKVAPDKIVVIHNGVSISEQDEPKPAIFDTVEVDLWIGIVANLKPVKRIDLFLKGLSYLKQNCEEINFRAVILGDGHERERLQQLAKKLDLYAQVHFLGAVSNVPAYLHHFDIGVLCSDREGFSNAILEYMACRLPVVATAVGGNVELVDDFNGIHVPPDNPIALGQAIEHLALNPELRKEMGEHSFEKVQREYAWEGIRQMWQDYYLSLVEQEKR